MKKVEFFTRIFSGFLTASILVTTVAANLTFATVKTKADSKDAINFQSSMNYGGERDDSYKGMAATKDGGFVAVGYSLGDSTSPAWSHVAAIGYNDPIMVKYNSNMEVEWARDFGTSSNDVFYDCDVLNDGTIVAVGQTKAKCEGQQNGPDTAMLIALVNPTNPDDNEIITLGGSGGDKAESVVATSDGGFALAGYSAANDAKYWGDKKNFTDLKIEGVVVKYNANREVEWASVANPGLALGLSGDDLKLSRFYGITQDHDGNIIAVGDHQIAKSLYNASIVKFDGKTGSELWTKSVGSNLTTAPTDGADFYTGAYTAVSVLSDNSLIATGYTKAEATTQENFACYGSEDGVYAKYSADGSLITADNIGTINGTVSIMGSYIDSNDSVYLYGSTDSVIKEENMRNKGYNWGNYGAHDAIIINYNSNMQVNWANNYGGENGDYINAFTKLANGEFVAVGEATSTASGNINLNNNGKVDAIVLAANKHSAATTSKTIKDGKVVYADGVYEGSANGYKSVIKVSVTIKRGEIIEVKELAAADTEGFYSKARALYDTIVKEQTTDVDVVSGATLSSNGIKNATANALSKASAKTVVDVIDSLGEITINSKSQVTNARYAYNQLGTDARTYVTNLDKLIAAEKKLIELTNGAYVIDYGTESDSKDSKDSDTEDVSHKTAILDDKGNVTNDGAKEIIGNAIAPNDIYYRFQDEVLKDISWNSFRNKKITGKDARIAIIDSGITPNHEDIDYNHILKGHNYVDNSDDTSDSLGHGTAVAGIIGAISNNAKGVSGVLSEADIVPLKVSGKSADIYQLTNAIYDAVDKYNVDVITMSIGVKKTASNEEDLKALEEAVNYAASKNVIILAAVGNAGKADYYYPAAFTNVVGVGYLDDNGQINPKSEVNDSVFVVAPGTNIYELAISKRMKCKIASGSSYSTPYVSAMALAAKSINKDMTVEEFKSLLMETSKDLGPAGYDTSYGYGEVDYEKFASRLVTSVENVIISEDKPLLLAQNGTNSNIKGLENLELKLGDSKQLIANVLPTDARNKDIVWYSSNPNIASIENGLIETKAVGNVTIAAVSVDGAKMAQLKLEVLGAEDLANNDTANNTVDTSGNEEIAADTTEVSNKKSASTGDNLYLIMLAMLVIMGLSAKTIYKCTKKTN